MKFQRDLGLLCVLLFFGAGLQAQIALEVAQRDGRYSIYPFIEKGSAVNPSDYDAGIYTTNHYQPQASDFRDPVYVEFLLNDLKLYDYDQKFEVIYLIPENKLETLVVCKLNEEMGYLRLIRLTENSEP